MDKITLKNFRCFREEQTARLAPLTLLVGENSTGKTSFMALIRALWDVAFAERVPDFREPPYNLGSFRDIVHNRGGRGKPAESFEAGFEYGNAKYEERVAFEATFLERLENPFPSKRRFFVGQHWTEIQDLGEGKHIVRQGNISDKEETTAKFDFPYPEANTQLAHSFLLSHFSGLEFDLGPFQYPNVMRPHPYASAPIRSRPQRTYDSGRIFIDPEGEYIPGHLNALSHLEPDRWKRVKDRLERFGSASGLFDEISVKTFGEAKGPPFQLQVRKFSGKGRKGPQRNLIDVGYGVSQVLPVLTELLEPGGCPMYLLQQPEIHLHPRAQAALGSLFCDLAGQGQQLIVETHSEYLIDRVRIDIRDKKSALTHEDVSILYFEPGDLDVKIHSIRFDEYGNVLDAPPSYGKFFMEEVSRSIGIGL